MCIEFLSVAISTHINHIEVVSPQFVSLHCLYGTIYNRCYEWFDRFAERAMACGEAMPTFKYEQVAPKSKDRIIDVYSDLTVLKTALTKYRIEDDVIGKAMIDEAIAEVDIWCWKLKSIR